MNYYKGERRRQRKKGGENTYSLLRTELFARTARRYYLYHQTDTKIICRLPAGYRTEAEETKY